MGQALLRKLYLFVPGILVIFAGLVSALAFVLVAGWDKEELAESALNQLIAVVVVTVIALPTRWLLRSRSPWAQPYYALCCSCPALLLIVAPLATLEEEPEGLVEWLGGVATLLSNVSAAAFIFLVVYPVVLRLLNALPSTAVAPNRSDGRQQRATSGLMSSIQAEQTNSEHSAFSPGGARRVADAFIGFLLGVLASYIAGYIPKIHIGITP